MNGVARHLGCAPMALYNHFRNKSDLVLGIGNRVSEAITLPDMTGLPWHVQARRWMSAMHDQLKPNAVSIRLVGTAPIISPRWMQLTLVLMRSLREGGLDDDTVVMVSRWLSQIVISDLFLNPAENPQVQMPALESVQDALDADDRALYHELLPSMASTGVTMFDFIADEAIERVKTLAETGFEKAAE